MAVYQDKENSNVYVIPVQMDDRTPEEIAWDAAMQINALMDQIAAERVISPKGGNKGNDRQGDQGKDTMLHMKMTAGLWKLSIRME